MSKLDSAYDIDPLFHKMSKSFNEGGAKGLLLGNLGVSQHGCRIVFDSKEDDNGAVGNDKVLVT
jgi:condensin complex subunit 2